jgi:hypothetical protein
VGPLRVGPGYAATIGILGAEGVVGVTHPRRTTSQVMLGQVGQFLRRGVDSTCLCETPSKW